MTTPARHLDQVDMTKIVSLAKRRGFVFPASEIYGGVGSTWDYGPLGVELKRNVKEAWWTAMVRSRDDVVGLDSAIIQAPQVWQASGHAEGFTDPLVECPTCHKRFRADHLDDATRCPEDGATLSAPRLFNLMFKTFVGPLEDSANQVWLRPETAQGIFINFDNVQTATRLKLPFGIAQVGKSFRNEITPGNFIFRTREFEQMEMEFFCKPGEDDHWHEHWIEQRWNWYVELGLRPERMRLRPHEQDELAHYAKGTSDIEYLFPWGWAELEGIANRTDFDLGRHEQHSGHNMKYFDQEASEHYWPYVIEPAAGVDRAALAFLVDAYDEEPAPEGKKEDARTVLHLHPDLAPVQVAVLPLSRNEKLAEATAKALGALRGRFAVAHDDAQSIGRRYRRQDEVGTPLCVTVDFQTVEEDNAVTIRNRDAMTQVRVGLDRLEEAVRAGLREMGSRRV